MEKAELSRLLASRSVTERIQAVQFLVQRADASHQDLLLRALSDKSNYVASRAAEALGRIADGDALRLMRDRFLYLSEEGLKRDPGCEIRARLAFAFGQQTFREATEALRIGVRTVQIEPVGGVPFDTGAHLRANCALALGQLKAPGAIRDISLLLFEPNDLRHHKVEMRKAAAQALALTCDANALVPLALRLAYHTALCPDCGAEMEMETPEVLQECMQAAVALDDERALELLAPFIQHRNRPLAAFACLMIAQTRLPDAAKTLFEATPHFRDAPLQAVLLALASMRTEEAQEYLLELTRSPRVEIAETLLAIADDMPADLAETCLAHLAKWAVSKRVREAAAQRR